MPEPSSDPMLSDCPTTNGCGIAGGGKKPKLPIGAASIDPAHDSHGAQVPRMTVVALVYVFGFSR